MGLKVDHGLLILLGPGRSIVRMGGARLNTSFLVREWVSDNAGLPSNQ